MESDKNWQQRDRQGTMQKYKPEKHKERISNTGNTRIRAWEQAQGDARMKTGWKQVWCEDKNRRT